ncbi:hypothetical protein SISNIDRAFT_489664 [Sistotremastrum niveocremeum HHB9708]|uniref:Uncharacterized protein n=1 Tax=Sistotremastrum niveocremeum HHB9708 TaxID=1314777 RepID=A0A164PSV4_9AGAM|nr:hypothetical protein SISNIDRAFT_489664 [Sistotremastrum niveocremeum HHB9708]
MAPSAASLGTYAITGVQTGLGPEAGRTPIRQEIDTWAYDEANAIQVDLFIQALIIFQGTEPDEKLSWFRIAAIHSIAPNPWDEETKTQNDGANC